MMPNGKEKITRKWLETASQVQNVKNSDICLHRIRKLLIQFCGLTLSNLPWKHPPDIYFSEQTLNSDLKVLEDQSMQRSTPAYSPRLEYEYEIASPIYFFGHGVLHVEQFCGIFIFTIMVRKQIQRIQETYLTSQHV